jgi:hypothetical protein
VMLGTTAKQRERGAGAVPWSQTSHLHPYRPTPVRIPRPICEKAAGPC